jgi:hypothetical protein
MKSILKQIACYAFIMPEDRTGVPSSVLFDILQRRGQVQDVLEHMLIVSVMVEGGLMTNSFDILQLTNKGVELQKRIQKTIAEKEAQLTKPENVYSSGTIRFGSN